jgi:carbon monoxide dehydrogenase subunit G
VPTPASLTVAVDTELDATPADVWKVVGDFGGVDSFLEVVESVEVEGEGVGAVRTLNLPEGAQFVETLTALDAEAMTLSYRIDESPLPVEGYAATIRVSELEDGSSKVDWSATFKAKGASDADARKAISDIFDMGFAGLEQLFPDTGAEEEETSQ